LAAFSLQAAFLCNAMLFFCGALVAWRWLGGRRSEAVPAERSGPNA
jgi:hypothetical protein